MTEIFEKMKQDLYAGNVEEVQQATHQALQSGINSGDILALGLIAGMDAVGADFKAGRLFIPEVLMCARAMHAGLDILRPSLAESKAQTLGTVVIGTVEGDLHDIGKNLVGMMLEGAGFTIVDLGTSVKPAQFVQAAIEHQAQVVGMSALLTTTMHSMQATIETLRAAGLGDKVKVIIGGAPVTAQFAADITADRYASDAGVAVDTVRELIC